MKLAFLLILLFATKGLKTPQTPAKVSLKSLAFV